jgi:hypothetical protein
VNDYQGIDAKEFLMVLKYGLVTGLLGHEKFIHKTIAEFFGLLFLIKGLKQEGIFLFFLRVILVERRFQVIRGMFDSCLKSPPENFNFASCITQFGSQNKIEDYSSALSVASCEGNSKTAEIFFLNFLDFSNLQELTKFEKSLTDGVSFLPSYISKIDDEIGILDKLSGKFGVKFVEGILRTKFESKDGSPTDLLSSALSNGKNLVRLLQFIRWNFLLDSDLLESCFLQTDKSGQSFVEKVLNLKFSKQKVEALQELLEIQKTGAVISTEISLIFKKNLSNCDPENSLLLDALKVENIETFKLLVEFVDDPSIFPKILSKLLQFCLTKFGDQFNILHPLRRSLDPNSSEGNQSGSYSGSIKILLVHFPDDSRSFLKVLLDRSESAGGSFLASVLDSSTTEYQFIFHLNCILDVKKFLGSNIFKALILNLFDEIANSQILNFLDLEETRVIKFLDFLGLDLAIKLVVRVNRIVSQGQDHEQIKKFYLTVLNYFDEKTGEKTSSFEQLKLEAFRQLPIDQNFSSFVRPDKNQQQNLNRILIDLEIFHESSEGFHFSNKRISEIFGFMKFQEILKETDDFTANFRFPENTEIESLIKFLCLTAVAFTSGDYSENLMKVCEMDPELMQRSILGRNSAGQNFIHFLVDSGLQNPLMMEFLDFLKLRFGLKFVAKLLKLENNQGSSFWSYAYENNSDSFLEEILVKLSGSENDLANLKNLALNLIFGRENFIENYEKEFFEIQILTKVNNEVNFSDPKFLIYFGLRSFHDYLNKNFNNEYFRTGIMKHLIFLETHSDTEFIKKFLMHKK